ncbi:MAG TPA: NADPH:quinone oxidoreductase family protein [Hyphomicrobium sp.]|nr:NADPH:quinone oxidoreductase family protein [Hyphomicrobium sp.]
MKAALCNTLSGPAGLEIRDIPPPQPKSGQALVAVKAVGLNFADTLITRGKYQYRPELPFSPGAEIAGVIERIDGAARGLRPGQRVMAYVGWGGAAEHIAVDVDMLVPVPDAVRDTVAASLSVTYGTALHGLAERGRLAAGETVVVTGAAGGAGLAAVEVANLMGSRVIAVASTPEKLAIARQAGASEGILFPGMDLKLAVRELTNGAGADVVYDCVGGEAAEPLIRALAWKGRFLVVGFAAGDIPRIPLNLLLVKGAEATGVFWGESVQRDPAGHRAGMARLLDWVAQGRLHPRTHGTFPLDEIAAALGVLEARAARGKVVLTL